MALLAVTSLALVGLIAGPAIADHRARSPEAFCRQLALTQNLDRSLANLDPVAVRADLAQLQRLDEVSPSEIEPSVAVLVRTTTDLLPGLDRAAEDSGAALDQAWRDRAAEIDAITLAGQSVQDYAQAHCGIELTPPTA